MTVTEICRLGRISRTALYRRSAKEGWRGRKKDAAKPAAKSGKSKKPAKEPHRADLVGRLYRAFERQVADAEARLSDAALEGAAGEKEARTLGTLARTLEKLIELQGELEDKKPDDSGERVDILRLRRKLARRIARMRGSGDA